ncbi:MAG: hypothetical protein M3327_12580, partial [Actinomycetota bacterium]|nr:hypothetical protein [Actinomycetota bacterium]
RGARTLVEAREIAASVLVPPAPGAAAASSQETLERFRDLRTDGDEDLDPAGARALVGELRDAGVNLRSLRVALTGAERGPELWTVLVALPRAEALRRVEVALAAIPGA